MYRNTSQQGIGLPVIRFALTWLAKPFNQREIMTVQELAISNMLEIEALIGAYRRWGIR
jgi:hypothetical protein